MRSHFLPRKVTAACAVAGATTLLSGGASAQTFVAADYATNPTYTAGWSAGQNGGYGFGAWSFDWTEAQIGTETNDVADPGDQQTISSAAAIGTAWTLFNFTSTNGISVVGRSFNETGGLQPGQTFETVLQNPDAFSYYRGFDILFGNSTNNVPGGDNAVALRLLTFYQGFATNWKVVDDSGTTFTPLTSADTAAAGMKLDFTLLSTNTYSLTMTPLGDPSSAYTQTGTLAYSGLDMNTGLTVTNLPINWVTYRQWNTGSSGPNDTTDNFFISSMTIAGLTLNIQVAGTNAILSWPTNVPGFYLESTSNLKSPANWISNSISPAVVNSLNVVTNPITGQQQFFRLQFQQ